RRLIAHEAFNEGDGFSVRRPDRPSDLQRWLMDGRHCAGAGIDGEELGDIPIVVSIAARGSGYKVLTVRRPVVFVDVHVSRSDLAKGAAGDVDECEALFVKTVFNFAGFGDLGFEWARSAWRIFDEEERDGFPIGRPARCVKKTFHVSEFFCRAS